MSASALHRSNHKDTDEENKDTTRRSIYAQGSSPLSVSIHPCLPSPPGTKESPSFPPCSPLLRRWLRTLHCHTRRLHSFHSTSGYAQLGETTRQTSATSLSFLTFPPASPPSACCKTKEKKERKKERKKEWGSKRVAWMCLREQSQTRVRVCVYLAVSLTAAGASIGCGSGTSEGICKKKEDRENRNEEHAPVFLLALSFFFRALVALPFLFPFLPRALDVSLHIHSFPHSLPLTKRGPTKWIQETCLYGGPLLFSVEFFLPIVFLRWFLPAVSELSD